jgi:hypothetical protein
MAIYYSTYLCYRPDYDDEEEAEEIEASSAHEAATEYCHENSFDEEDEFDVNVKLANHMSANWQRFLVVREVEVTYVASPQ